MDYRLATFDDLRVGQQASFSKTITEADISHFVALSGDVNPLHVNEVFARQTFFGGRIAHGLLSASLLSTIVGMLLPGVGAIYRSQTLEFLRPVRIGDTLTASAQVISLDAEANRIELECRIVNQAGDEVIRGAAAVSLLRGMGAPAAAE
ncbi:MAG: MaoC family dehydratase [Deferrisomatales bacterium]